MTNLITLIKQKIENRKKRVLLEEDIEQTFQESNSAQSEIYKSKLDKKLAGLLLEYKVLTGRSYQCYKK